MKNPRCIYRLIRTRAFDFEEYGYPSVYSILAVYPENGEVSHEFIYDVTRSEEKAIEIVRRLREGAEIGDITERISELIG